MNPQYVTPEIAKLLKEKGFAEECSAQYQIALTSRKDKEDGYSGSFGWKKGEVTFDRSYFVNNSKHDYSNKSWLGCGAPLWQEAIDWFDSKQIFISAELKIDDGTFKWYPTIKVVIDYKFQVVELPPRGSKRDALTDAIMSVLIIDKYL